MPASAAPGAAATRRPPTGPAPCRPSTPRTCRRCRPCSARPARSGRCSSAWDRRRHRPACAAATRGSRPSRTARSPTSPPRSRSPRRGAAVLDRPRRGDRRSRRRGAGGVARRSGGRRGPRAADGARLRAQRARRRRDGGPRRGPLARGAPAGRGSSSRSVQALLQHTIAPGDLPAAARALRLGHASSQDALLARPARPRLRARCIEVAGRGEFARRGGHRRRLPAVGADLPVRIEFFGDEIESICVRSTRPTSGPTGPVDEVVLLPATEFLLPARRAGRIRSRASAGGRAGHLGGAAGRRPGALRGRELDGPLGRPAGGRARAPWTSAMPPRSGRPVLAPATGLDHLEPGDAPRPRRAGRHRRGGGLPVAPGGRAARASWSRPGSSRGTGPPTYLAPRDWKSRLLARARWS